MLMAGFDFIKELLNPPPLKSHPDPPTFLHNELVKTKFPANVKLLVDKRLEKRKLDELNAKKSQMMQMNLDLLDEYRHQKLLRAKTQAAAQAFRKRKEDLRKPKKGSSGTQGEENQSEKALANASL
jgi:hypothetical protein